MHRQETRCASTNTRALSLLHSFLQLWNRFAQGAAQRCSALLARSTLSAANVLPQLTLRTDRTLLRSAQTATCPARTAPCSASHGPAPCSHARTNRTLTCWNLRPFPRIVYLAVRAEKQKEKNKKKNESLPPPKQKENVSLAGGRDPA